MRVGSGEDAVAAARAAPDAASAAHRENLITAGRYGAGPAPAMGAAPGMAAVCNAYSPHPKPNRIAAAAPVDPPELRHRHCYTSKKHRVAMFQPPRRTRTPRGAHVGSTLSEVKRAYPGVRRDNHGFWGVTAPRNHRALYQFEVERGQVTMMALNLKDQVASTDRPRDRVVRRLSRARRRLRPAVPAVGFERPTTSFAFGCLRGVRDAVEPGDQIAQGGQLLCQRT